MSNFLKSGMKRSRGVISSKDLEKSKDTNLSSKRRCVQEVINSNDLSDSSKEAAQTLLSLHSYEPISTNNDEIRAENKRLTEENALLRGHSSEVLGMRDFVQNIGHRRTLELVEDLQTKRTENQELRVKLDLARVENKELEATSDRQKNKIQQLTNSLKKEMDSRAISQVEANDVVHDLKSEIVSLKEEIREFRGQKAIKEEEVSHSLLRIERSTKVDCKDLGL